MSRISVILFLFIALFMGACSSTSNLSKQTDKASQAYAVGDYENAFSLYNTYIQGQKSANKEIEGAVYGAAAKAAYKIDKLNIAEDFYKQAYYKKYADADMYADMQNIYKQIDNLSKEIDALEFFKDNFKEDSRFSVMQKRLFETYIESENWDKAVALWPSCNEETQAEEKYMELYFIAQNKMDNSAVVDQLASALLEKNKNNQLALEHKAEKYFWNAEKRYQKELDAYEKNKTNKQYTKMVKALDVISLDFKKSLGYFEKLYKLYPSKDYAKYMSNIYIRFQDKKKSEYYRKLSM